MSNQQKITEHLEGNFLSAYCDDCLSVILKIFPRQTVNQICRKSSKSRGKRKIERKKKICSSCLKHKETNMIINEDSFRDWLVKKIKNHKKFKNSNWRILNSKNVCDVILCMEDENNPQIAFVEVKYHKEKHGRIGIGDREGMGFQPEILDLELFYFEHYMRWIIADEKDYCIFVDNKTIRRNLCGKLEKGKQNNIKNTILNSENIERFKINDSIDVIIKWINTL